MGGGYSTHLIQVLIYKNDPGIFTGAMWFLPFLCVSLIIYYMSDHASRMLCKWNDMSSAKAYMNVETIRFVLAVLLMIIGIVLIEIKELSKYNINVSMLMQPVILMGEKMYKCFIEGEKYKQNVFRLAFMPLALFMLLFLNATNSELELSKRIIPEHLQILIIPIALLFCLSFAAFLENFKLTSKIFGLFGAKSFYIMAFHFMVFKGVDAIIGKLCMVDYDVLLLYPYSFRELRFVYILLGMILPLFIAILVGKLKKELTIKFK